MIPGAGATSVPVSKLSGREPVVFGKVIKPLLVLTVSCLFVCSLRLPCSSTFKHVTRQGLIFNFLISIAALQVDPRRTLMIGDRLDTDVLFGNSNKLDTMLVGTGVHQLADIEAAKKTGHIEQLPNFFAPSVRVFLDD